MDLYSPLYLFLICLRYFDSDSFELCVFKYILSFIHHWPINEWNKLLQKAVLIEAVIRSFLFYPEKNTLKISLENPVVAVPCFKVISAQISL